NFSEAGWQWDEVERARSCRQVVETTTAAKQGGARQRVARLQANEVFDDSVSRPCQTIDANQIDARLMRLIPRVEGAEPVVADEPRGREQYGRIRVGRIARQRRRCKIGSLGPSALKDPTACQLAIRRFSR